MWQKGHITYVKVVFGGDHYKYDAGGLYPLRFLPGRILHKCAENFTTGLKKAVRLFARFFLSSRLPAGVGDQQRCLRIVPIPPFDSR